MFVLSLGKSVDRKSYDVMKLDSVTLSIIGWLKSYCFTITACLDDVFSLIMASTTIEHLK